MLRELRGVHLARVLAALVGEVEPAVFELRVVQADRLEAVALVRAHRHLGQEDEDLAEDGDEVEDDQPHDREPHLRPVDELAELAAPRLSRLGIHVAVERARHLPGNNKVLVRNVSDERLHRVVVRSQLRHHREVLLVADLAVAVLVHLLDDLRQLFRRQLDVVLRAGTQDW